MDIKRDKPKKLKLNGKAMVGVATAALIGAAIWVGNATEGLVLNKDKVRIAKVERGELEVAVRGAGEWKPSGINFIDAQVAGRIEQIVKRAGEQVQAGDVIMLLSNPQIARQFEEADLAYSAAKADHKALKARLQSQMLDRQAALMQLKVELQSANMEVEANRELNSRHQAIVAEIDFKRAELKVSQLKQMLEFQTQLLTAYEQNVDAEIEASLARVSQVEQVRARAKNLVDGLQVKASIDGVVQDNPLKVGQRVAEGEPLSKVVDLNTLYAEVRLPAQRARQIKSGMPSVINTRFTTVNATVGRIDPNVINGQIKVDLILDAQIPEGVRPDMELTATVMLSKLHDTLHVTRPFQVEGNRASAIYVINDEGIATRTKVTFGDASATKLQIINGLEVGDEILVSDTSMYREHDVITLR